MLLFDAFLIKGLIQVHMLDIRDEFRGHYWHFVNS
jgi:hypothetical protein